MILAQHLDPTSVFQMNSVKHVLGIKLKDHITVTLFAKAFGSVCVCVWGCTKTKEGLTCSLKCQEAAWLQHAWCFMTDQHQRLKTGFASSIQRQPGLMLPYLSLNRHARPHDTSVFQPFRVGMCESDRSDHLQSVTQWLSLTSQRVVWDGWDV